MHPHEGEDQTWLNKKRRVISGDLQNNSLYEMDPDELDQIENEFTYLMTQDRDGPDFWYPRTPVARPSSEEILDGLEHNLSRSHEPGRAVCRAGPKVVFKSGIGQNMHSEFHNLAFLQTDHPGTIPTPRIYGYTRSGDNVTIWMEYVEGETLDEYLPRASPDERRAIEAQVRVYYRRLRELRQPPLGRSRYGGMDGDQAYAENNHGGLEGPYIDPGRLVFDFINPGQYIADSPLSDHDTSTERVRDLMKEFDAAAGLYKPVFSHGDMSLSNIIRRPNGSLCFVDWEHAGWYPPWYDYLSTGRNYPLQFTEPYPELERIMDQMKIAAPSREALAASFGGSFVRQTVGAGNVAATVANNLVNLVNTIDQLRRR
ncbi:kinase-like domain-containing protein [Xylariaceae sp. FL1019]|nr:kinase-like domain-containing protein [Xylariaceae sp. FL1019]